MMRDHVGILAVVFFLQKCLLYALPKSCFEYESDFSEDVYAYTIPIQKCLLCSAKIAFWIRVCSSEDVFTWTIHVPTRDWILQERPYHGDSTASRLLSEVKHHRAWLVLRWGTTLESQVLFFCKSAFYVVQNSRANQTWQFFRLNS